MFVLDDEAKHLLDSDSPLVERPDRHGLPLAQVIVEPALADVLERDPLSLVDGFHQPYVFIQKVLCHIPNSSFVFAQLPTSHLIFLSCEK